MITFERASTIYGFAVIDTAGRTVAEYDYQHEADATVKALNSAAKAGPKTLVATIAELSNA